MTTAAERSDAAADTDLPRGLAGAAIAVTAWSAGTILAKDIDMGALAIGAYRFGFFFAVLLGWMLVRGIPIRLRVLRDSAIGGLALGADIALFFSAVKETSIVNATIIGSLQPVVVGVVAARFFGEKIAARDALWSLVALAGVVVIVTSGADDDITSLRGDLLAAGAMLAWSTYFIASKESRKRMSPTEFTAGTSIWTAVICVIVGLIAGQDLSWPSASNWGWLIAMAIGSGVVGHALMNWSLVRIPLWVGSTFTLFIPVASALLAWVFLDEAVSAAQGLAMAAVIASLAMIVRGQTRRAADERAAVASAASAGSSTPLGDERPAGRSTPDR